MTLPFSFERTLEIRARRATVFRFFTDPERFARWWGAGSTIEPAIGGVVRICYPGGTIASGTVQEIIEPRRIAFTYGYEDPTKPIARGASLVTITLEEFAGGTRVSLRHDVADAAARDEHAQGWRYQMAVFAKVASEDEHRGVGTAIDAWFAGWNATAPDEQRALLAPIVAPDVSFRDAFGCTSGLDELLVHVAACQRFMPGIRLEGVGRPRHAHGTVLADWRLVRPDGSALIAGTSVFRVAPGGAIADVVGVSG